jgi:hypothetical protein
VFLGEDSVFRWLLYWGEDSVCLAAGAARRNEVTEECETIWKQDGDWEI